MTEPLSHEQIWGEPEHDDEIIKEMLAGSDENFDDAHYCPECGEPVHLCKCDLINMGEDYDCP